jgi:hypothetical protein
MANSSVDNGKQVITFAYQQEGTAKGFNKILHGILPRGIISGGEISKVSDSEVTLSPMQILIGDNDVTCHVETTENATVTVGPSSTLVYATYVWQDITNSYVNFQAGDWNTITSLNNVILFGECEFSGNTLNYFDYTRRSWSNFHYENDFQYYNANNKLYYPNFAVTPDRQVQLKLLVEIGKAVINGVFIDTTGDGELSITLQNTDATQSNYFIKPITHGRNDLLVINSAKQLEYIMGEDTLTAPTPLCPSDSLAIAKITLGSGTHETIFGHEIEYIYNNNYYNGASTLGRKVGNSVINRHTLYI